MARVLITGSSQGIGRAAAIELAARGHEVIATARRPETLIELPAVERLSLDVTDQDSVDAAIAQAGRVDVLVSNAGATVRGTIESTPLDEFERMYQLNTLGALRVVKALLPSMRERRSGKLVFVSSIQGRMVLPLIGAYSQSKWAYEALAETLALEVGSLGIEVSVLEPGMVATNGAASAAQHTDGEPDYAPLWERLAQMPTNLRIDAEDVARAIADNVEDDGAPLRSGVGLLAEHLLEARRRAPVEAAFDTNAAMQQFAVS